MSLWRTILGQPVTPTSDFPPPSVADPDQTWRILDLVIGWLRHAETKAAATLATAGVAGGVLFNLLKEQKHPGAFLSVVAVVATSFLVVGGLAAVWALRPRLFSSDDPTSRIYFHHIARAHPKKSGGGAYLDTVRALSASQEELVVEIAGQIWNNARVAKAKFMWANIALAFILLAIVALGAIAIAIGLQGR